VSPFRVLLASATMGLGAGVQGLIGFGANLIAAPLLVLIDPRFAPGPVNLASALLNILLVLRARRAHLPSDPLVRFGMIGEVPGTILAGVVLSVLAARGLSIAFAALVVLAVLLSVSGLSLARTRHNLAAAGALAGFMGTISGIGGPPIALVYQHEPAATLRGTLPKFFLVGSALTLATLAVVGKLGWEEARLGLALLPGMLIGLRASKLLAGHVDQRSMRPAVLALSAIAAVSVLLREML